MPVLTPSLSPPISEPSTGDLSNTIPSGSDAKTGVAAVVMPPSQDSEAKPSEPPSTVSRVSLDVEHINAEIASDLASALVGHVLFLKNQVPFPVMQLYRIPGGKSTSKALKLRTDLLASFDTLSCHLISTFRSLSTAFARAAGPSPGPTRRAYLAILVGPSIGSAKTKVIFAVDGLVAKIWGERDDVEEERDDESEESDDESDEEDVSDASTEDDADEQPSDTDSSTESDVDASSPPPSPSPSPSPCTSPLPPPPSHSQPILRLLAHTLATAEHSMSAELAPTQTHILLRAPRRFTHPAWIPRQGASSALESALREFREEAGVADTSALTLGRRKARTKAPKVEGVWVACRSAGVEFPDDAGGGRRDDLVELGWEDCWV
ncbi:hypothetical protein MVEN_02443500 [Mycena venus]|uniref:Uncharacterized protein n=1 Tax=Mycena venus TaxID=2733690 RepID=A0A8H7CCF6_9AGAR|nr:hypothetical protein MVEN_02443500 [Mycena venus]